MGRWLVGIGGWVFPEWRGVFYPPGLPQAQELPYAARHLGSIEINGTFYRTQARASFAKWREQVPDDFVFSLKAPRFTTHRRELSEAGASIERFIDSGITELKTKLGPILWQFPPTARFDEKRFAAFFALLPRSHDGITLRHAVEAKHQSFADPAYAALLRKHGIANAILDPAPYEPVATDAADFVYLRLKGTAAEVETGYPADQLDNWREQIAEWSQGRDAFVYFIAGAKIRAPAAAMAFIAALPAPS